MNIMTESELEAATGSKKYSISVDDKTYDITLSETQRNLLMYTGLGILGYFLIKSLINSAVKKINDD